MRGGRTAERLLQVPTTAGTREFFSRHCEDKSTKQSSLSFEAGLLRCARNDAGGLFRKSPVQPNPKKYVASTPTRNTFLIAPSRPTEGRSRSSRTRGEMRWTLLGTADERG